MIGRFFKDSSIYAVPSLISRGIGFVLLPVYTRYLTPADYGVIEFLAVAFAILNLTIPLEVTQAVARMLPDAVHRDKRRYASTSFWFTFMGFFVFAIVVWLFPGNLANLILGDATLTREISIAVLAMMANALFYLMQNQLRWTMQPKAYALTGLIFSIITAMVAVSLVVLFNMGVMGVIYGQLAGSVAALLCALQMARSTVAIGFVLDLKALKEMLAFSAPLVFSGIAIYFTLYTDRWVLREYLSIGDVGLYSVAYRLAAIASLFIVAFQMSLTPLVYQYYKEPETPQLIGDIFSYFLALVLPFVLFISLFSHEIIMIFATPSYYEAAFLVPWLTLAVVIMNMYVFSPGLGIAKKTGTRAVVSIVAAVANILLNFLLVAEYGRVGAAIATLCSAVIMTGLLFWLGNREYAVFYRKWRSSLAFLVTIFVIIAFNMTSFTFMIKALSWLFWSLVIIAMLITQDDWIKFWAFFGKRRIHVQG